MTGQYAEIGDAEKRNLSSLGEPRSGGYQGMVQSTRPWSILEGLARLPAQSLDSQLRKTPGGLNPAQGLSVSFYATTKGLGNFLAIG